VFYSNFVPKNTNKKPDTGRYAGQASEHVFSAAVAHNAHSTAMLSRGGHRHFEYSLWQKNSPSVVSCNKKKVEDYC